MKEGNTYRLIKEANTHLVLNAIREYEPLTVEECISKTHLSRPTVLNALEKLQSSNLIEKSGYGESAWGRQPVLYALKLDAYYAIGVDLEFPPIRIVISDIKGGTLYSREWMQAEDDGMKDIENRILEEISAGMEKFGIRNDMLVGIGIGISGTANIRTNLPVNIVRIKDGAETTIGERIQEHFQVPVHLRNDAHLVAVAEQFFSKDSRDFIYVAYRSGIGSAIYMNHHLFNGEYGNAGFIGHTTIDINGEQCICGQRGCLELYCSKSAIRKKYAAVTGEERSYTEILKLADEGDENARGILQVAGKYLGTSLANMIKMFDISNVILGYLECGEDNIFFVTIKETIEQLVSDFVLNGCTVKIGIAGKYDFALGGGLYVLDKFFDKPKLRLTI